MSPGEEAQLAGTAQMHANAHKIVTKQIKFLPQNCLARRVDIDSNILIARSKFIFFIKVTLHIAFAPLPVLFIANIITSLRFWNCPEISPEYFWGTHESI